MAVALSLYGVSSKAGVIGSMTQFIDRIFDKTLNGLSRSLDLTWKRNQAISSNIANAETPQYRAVDVDFGRELERAFGRSQTTLAATNPKHIDTGASGPEKLVPDLSGPTKPDGNNVDLDLQMGRLAYNSGKYSIAANLMRKQLTILRNVIREAGR